MASASGAIFLPLCLLHREIRQGFQQFHNQVLFHILVYGQLGDPGGLVFNHFFRSPLLACDGGLDRGAVQQHFLFGHPVHSCLFYACISITQNREEYQRRKHFSYAFRSPLWWGLDNLSCLPADCGGKTLKQRAFYRPKCVDKRYLFCWCLASFLLMDASGYAPILILYYSYFLPCVLRADEI